MKTNSNFPGHILRPDKGVLPRGEVLAIFEPLTEEKVGMFGQQVDEELARLEERFAHFQTVKSMRRSFGR